MPHFEQYTDAEVAALRRSGAILGDCLQSVATLVHPGVTTAFLDAAAEAFIRKHNADPAFKGYRGYPATLCISVNDECVHGIPGKRVLKSGDVVKLDGGVRYKGMITDACITVPVGSVTPLASRLMRVTEAALAAGLGRVRAGVRVGEVSSTIQRTIEAGGFSAVAALTGHGVGRAVHLYPDIPNVGSPTDGPVLPAGAVIAIEPIVAAGRGEAMDGGDSWTILTSDGSLSAHCEHTVLVTKEGCDILTIASQSL